MGRIGIGHQVLQCGKVETFGLHLIDELRQRRRSIRSLGRPSDRSQSADQATETGNTLGRLIALVVGDGRLRRLVRCLLDASHLCDGIESPGIGKGVHGAFACTSATECSGVSKLILHAG